MSLLYLPPPQLISRHSNLLSFYISLTGCSSSHSRYHRSNLVANSSSNLYIYIYIESDRIMYIIGSIVSCSRGFNFWAVRKCTAQNQGRSSRVGQLRIRRAAGEQLNAGQLMLDQQTYSRWSKFQLRFWSLPFKPSHAGPRFSFREEAYIVHEVVVDGTLFKLYTLMQY